MMIIQLNPLVDKILITAALIVREVRQKLTGILKGTLNGVSIVSTK
jgi:hypothetical protein